MLPTSYRLPTLGHVHKVVCDCLGLWNSNNDSITFHVAASEKDRRAALRQAFEAIRNEDGIRYGSLDDLVAVTTRLAPQDTQTVKKSRTIQAYVNNLSKTDFDSFEEYSELQQYIKVLLTERYSRWGVAELAVHFYESALAHYRELVREYPCNAQIQSDSYQRFLGRDLRRLTTTITGELLPDDALTNTAPDAAWPLKAFADAASRITGISLHKLHQYHQFRQERPLDGQAWTRDLASWQVNTRSKQVVERLGKRNRMKWETFYPTIQPLAWHLPQAIPEKAFAMRAFASMIAHNLNRHAARCGRFAPAAQGSLAPVQARHGHSIPSSDLLDRLFNGHAIGDEAFIQEVSHRYRAMVSALRDLPGALRLGLDKEIPGSLEQIYERRHRHFAGDAWHLPLTDAPHWIDEWVRAGKAILANDAPSALSHFNAALEQARYVAGPLFVPFYIQVCAFCRSQYRLLSDRKQEDVFERLYEGLGSRAARYAGLLGYSPHYERDPKTLMPHMTLPGKCRLILDEIDARVNTLRT